MNPHYLWMTETLELLTFFAVAPAFAILIAYRAWREKDQKVEPKQYGMRCVLSGTTAVLLLGFARWLNAGVGTPQYFLQLTCTLLSFLFLGVCVGCGFSLFLVWWRWHNTTRLN